MRLRNAFFEASKLVATKPVLRSEGRKGVVLIRGVIFKNVMSAFSWFPWFSWYRSLLSEGYHRVLQGPAQRGGGAILLYFRCSPDPLFVQQNEPFLP